LQSSYGANRRGELACAFVRHALASSVGLVAMLLKVDFDSAKTRIGLFRDNPRFAGKVVLLNRIVWFEPEGAAGPSENHAWFVWRSVGAPQSEPWIRYADKIEAPIALPIVSETAA
jgi:hypothetical protein